MKKILIPTDFSENAGDALDYALQLIKGQKANIHIINVIQPLSASSNASINAMPLVNEEIIRANQAMDSIELFSKSLFGESENAKISISTSVEIGKIGSSINQKAKELDVDMVIMGTQGSNHGFLDKVIGTISTEVIDSAMCPVILVPKDYKFKVIDNVVFTTNLNHADPYELWNATELLSPNVKSVRCVYVTADKSKEDNKELEKFAKYMVKHSPTIETIFNVVESQDIESEIAGYAESYDAEMIIMHKDKKAIWRRIFTTSHTRKMIFWTKVPLMILN